MFFGVVLVGILVAHGCFKSINDGLPNRVAEENFGLTDLLYRALNVIAPFFLLYSLVSLRLNITSIIVGLCMYGVAHIIKKTAWNLSYGDITDD